MANVLANQPGKQQTKIWQSAWEGSREQPVDVKGAGSALSGVLPLTGSARLSPLMCNLDESGAHIGVEIHLASNREEARQQHCPPLLTLEFDAYYSFLHRYFENAQLDRRHELIDPQAGAVLEGYQLDRLEDELRGALIDITRRPYETWNVLVGWNSQDIGRDSEVWQPVEKRKLEELIHNLLGLIMRARDTNLKLVVSVIKLPREASLAQV